MVDSQLGWRGDEVALTHREPMVVIRSPCRRHCVHGASIEACIRPWLNVGCVAMMMIMMVVVGRRCGARAPSSTHTGWRWRMPVR